jgi:hypothetical protein
VKALALELGQQIRRLQLVADAAVANDEQHDFSGRGRSHE